MDLTHFILATQFAFFPKAVMTPAMTLCWSCQSPVDGKGMFCPACGIVQPPPAGALSGAVCAGDKGGGAFEVLALTPPRFDLDPALLEQAYLAAQRQVHPDRLTNRTAREQLFAGQWAMQLNTAHGILKDPVKRAGCLLALMGQGAGWGDDPHRTTVQDSEILQESLEQREALAEATTPAALVALADSTRQRQEQCLTALARAFAAADFEGARRETLRLTYVQKFAASVKDTQRRSL
jgi:molecular chaperone HscB